MKKIIITTILLTSIISLSGCSNQSEENVISNAEPEAVEEAIIEESSVEEISLEEVIAVEEIVRYKIEFVADWSSETHPGNYPANAHFSPFIAYSHSDQIDSRIFVEGGAPTEGIEEMAETGATTLLENEIQFIIDNNRAYQQTKGARIDSPGTDSGEIELAKDFTYLTFVTMLAPSPDWFVAGKTQLFEDGKWVEEVEVELVTYDAGSDAGTEFTSADKDVNPKESVEIASDEIQNLGKIILTKIDE